MQGEYVRCASCGKLVSEGKFLRDRSCRKCGGKTIRRYFNRLTLMERVGILFGVI